MINKQITIENNYKNCQLTDNICNNIYKTKYIKNNKKTNVN